MLVIPFSSVTNISHWWLSSEEHSQATSAHTGNNVMCMQCVFVKKCDTTWLRGKSHRWERPPSGCSWGRSARAARWQSSCTCTSGSGWCPWSHRGKPEQQFCLIRQRLRMKNINIVLYIAMTLKSKTVKRSYWSVTLQNVLALRTSSASFAMKNPTVLALIFTPRGFISIFVSTAPSGPLRPYCKKNLMMRKASTEQFSQKWS